jgi:hypothetical protein
MLLSEYDNFGAATGSLDLRTCTAAPTGGYAFAVNGVDSTIAENQLVIGGVLGRHGHGIRGSGEPLKPCARTFRKLQPALFLENRSGLLR